MGLRVCEHLGDYLADILDVRMDGAAFSLLWCGCSGND